MDIEDQFEYPERRILDVRRRQQWRAELYAELGDDGRERQLVTGRKVLGSKHRFLDGMGKLPGAERDLAQDNLHGTKH